MATNINRKKIRKLILKEFKMMGMADMGSSGFKPMGMTQNPMGCDACGASPCVCDEYTESPDLKTMPDMNIDNSHKGGVSKEDCCAAIMALIECCSCPVTQQVITECCEDLLAGNYNRQ
jgi:hypothetical protein